LAPLFPKCSDHESKIRCGQKLLVKSVVYIDVNL
jgi:hypothetical protein